MSFSRHDVKMNERIRSAESRALADPRRPVFHFRPPAQWMNDPNGTLHVEGWYHVFYQFNPYGDSWDHLHWGHARSRDLLSWEYLPIALYPDASINEEHCFSGCAMIDRRGRPAIIYTSVPFDVDNNPHSQRAALGDPQLVHWTRSPRPVLTVDSPGMPRIKNDWRDPYVYRKGDTYYMVISAVRDDDTPVVLLYTNQAGDLSDWEYRGVLKSFPRDSQLFECPNFFQMQGAWILIGSPFEPVTYYAGSFDEETFRYTPMKKGTIDHSTEYYATNTMLGPSNELLLLAWIRAFPKGLGWNGCLAIPRVLHLGDNGELLQSPAPVMERLRGAHYGPRECSMSPHGLRLSSASLRSSEILLRVNLRSDSGLELRVAARDKRTKLLSLDSCLLHVLGTPVRCEGLAEHTPREVDIHLFIDRSVLEIFIDGGRICVSHMVECLHEIDAFEADWSDTAGLAGFDAWDMNPLTYSLHPDLVSPDA